MSIRAGSQSCEGCSPELDLIHHNEGDRAADTLVPGSMGPSEQAKPQPLHTVCRTLWQAAEHSPEGTNLAPLGALIQRTQQLLQGLRVQREYIARACLPDVCQCSHSIGDHHGIRVCQQVLHNINDFRFWLSLLACTECYTPVKEPGLWCTARSNKKAQICAMWGANGVLNKLAMDWRPI